MLGMVPGGCASATARKLVLRQASFDHDCPAERVTVTQEDTTIWAYRLNVCGKDRKYRNFGNAKWFQFVDVTDGLPATARKD